LETKTILNGDVSIGFLAPKAQRSNSLKIKSLCLGDFVAKVKKSFFEIPSKNE
jgi:hypothetical protein